MKITVTPTALQAGTKLQSLMDMLVAYADDGLVLDLSQVGFADTDGFKFILHSSLYADTVIPPKDDYVIQRYNDWLECKKV